MNHSKVFFALVFLLIAAFAVTSFAQQPRRFDWLPANDETVRLDPANYHAGRTYRPNASGQNNHVDIKAQHPVTVFMTPEGDWTQALQHPEAIAGLRQICVREHVVQITFVCELPVEPMTLIIRDERYSPENAVFTGLGALLNPVEQANSTVGQGIAAVLNVERSVPRRFKDPNDVHIQYYRWDCVENCIQPEFQWTQQIKEKYELTSFLKVYGGFQPDHDGEQVSIKIKSPAPMVVAMLPSQVADQLHSQPDALESALQKNSCQQRGVQSLEFQCTFNLDDGPQSLVVAPEAGAKVPHKKAEIAMFAAQCVANCELLQSQK
ncbi:MAG TPA: hypothetical protein VMH48_07305 [Methylomirabilota bacterium]|nr:hypothetical protein [Methylomirabilota bacterium]